MELTLFDIIINLIEAAILVYSTFYIGDLNEKWNIKKYFMIVFILFIDLNIITVSNLNFIIQDIPAYIILFCGLKIYTKRDSVHIIFSIILSYIILQVSNIVSLSIISMMFNSSIKTLITDDIYVFDFAIILSKILFFVFCSYMMKFINRKLIIKLDEEWKIFVFIILPIWLIYVNIFEMLFSDIIDEFLILSTLFAFTILCPYMYFLFIQIQHDNKKKIQDAITIQKLKSEKESIDDLIEMNMKIHTLKHDIKHEFDFIQECLKNNDIEKVKEIVSSNLKEIEKYESVFFTKNETLNYILNSKNKKAHSSGLVLKCILENIDISFIEEQDFIILLGNLIDNAIEHSSKIGRTIYINMKQDEFFLMIDIQNLIDSDTINLISQKEDRQSHGYGVKSIQNIVTKYNGKLDYEVHNKILTCHIILKNDRLPRNTYRIPHEC